MPLLDIATPQPSFQDHVCRLRSHTFFHGKYIFGDDKQLAFPWKSIQVPRKDKNFSVRTTKICHGGLVIKAVATLEPNKCSVQTDVGHESFHNLQMGIDSRSFAVVEFQYLSEDSAELDDREKLRRMRISKANKGNTPWNKGKKHSAETLQRIKERTRLAMQDPKVKKKLANLGHAQSEETRVKIGVGVRMGWERRREKLMLQESCYFDWQNLIAEASRRGFVGEEELQWDSYKILNEQLEQQWLESVEQRKKMPRPKGSKRAPKAPEQRRKISEAISAKWSDPAYRDRVCSGLAKYHGVPVGVERKPRRRPSGDRQPRKRSPMAKRDNEIDHIGGNETKSQIKRPRVKRSNVPLYKDPLASSKLEMIKSIRAERASAEIKKTEAIARAKLLIAEAEKAAKALEVAAMRSPLAHTSLIETRKLIAEALQTVESLETEQVDSYENGRSTSVSSTGLVNHVEKEPDEKIEGPNEPDMEEVNGSNAFASSKSRTQDSYFGQFNFQELLNGHYKLLPANSPDHHSPNGGEEFYQTSSSDYALPPLELDSELGNSRLTEQLHQPGPNGRTGRENLLPNGAKHLTGREETQSNLVNTTKKWVRGRLVEEAAGD